MAVGNYTDTEVGHFACQTIGLGQIENLNALA